MGFFLSICEDYFPPSFRCGGICRAAQITVEASKSTFLESYLTQDYRICTWYFSMCYFHIVCVCWWFQNCLECFGWSLFILGIIENFIYDVPPTLSRFLPCHVMILLWPLNFFYLWGCRSYYQIAIMNENFLLLSLKKCH